MPLELSLYTEKGETKSKFFTETDVDIILDLFDRDPHQWSTRPCQTCKAISALVGKPFGCVRKAKEQP